jgi:hypothetical protein
LPGAAPAARSHTCLPTSPGMAPSLRPRRRAACSSTAPTTQSSSTSPRWRGPACRLSSDRSRA